MRAARSCTTAARRCLITCARLSTCPPTCATRSSAGAKVWRRWLTTPSNARCGACAEIVQGVLEVECRQAAGIDLHHDPRSVHGHEPLHGPEMVDLVGQNLVGRAALT